MVQDIANVNGVKTFVSEVKFLNITSGSLFWRNCLHRLVQLKFINLATAKMIATSLYSGEFGTYVFVSTTSFCKERILFTGSLYSLVRI